MPKVEAGNDEVAAGADPRPEVLGGARLVIEHLHKRRLSGPWLSSDPVDAVAGLEPVPEAAPWPLCRLTGHAVREYPIKGPVECLGNASLAVQPLRILKSLQESRLQR